MIQMRRIYHYTAETYYHLTPSNIFFAFALLIFCWSSFISLFMFRFKITCSSMSLFLANTPSLKSGNFYLYLRLMGLRSSMNFSFSRLKGAFSSYSFRNIFSSFL